MPGMLHIIELGRRRGQYGRTVGEYQVTYTDDGNTFVKLVSGDEQLSEFLRMHVAVPQESVEAVLAELKQTGRATLPDVEIPEGEAPAWGMVQEPTES